jgi:alpha-N-acetylglucosamine transferase
MAISAVLPLKASGSYDVNDLKRAHILFTSLQTFVAAGTISEIFVLVPAAEVELVKQEYACWQSLNIKVMAEDDLLPEFKKYPKMRGWRKQQLLKIAIANLVENEFYLTLDADVICLKPLDESKLIIDGKALLQYEQRAQHPKWWKSSARILNMSKS